MQSADWVIAKMIRNPNSQVVINDVIRPYYFDGIQKIVYEKIITHLEMVPEKDRNYQDVLDKDGKPKLVARISPTFAQLVDGDPKIGQYVSIITSYDEISDKELKTHMSNITRNYKRQSLAKSFQLGIDRLAQNVNMDEVASEVLELVHVSLMAENESPYVSQAEAVDDFNREFAKERAGEKPAISTGFKTLDYLLQGGLRRGDFLVVASATGQGKSTLANQLMLNFQKHMNCGLLGLEMDHKEYVRRQVSMLASTFSVPNLTQAHLSRAHMQIDEDAFNVITDELRKFNMVYLKPKDITIAEMKKHFKILVEKYKCEVLFLDHMLLINEGNMEERHKVGEIANFMKKFAAEHNILCVAVSQMTRDTDLTNPQVKDIAGGRGVEHAATQLLTIGLPSKKESNSDFHQNQEPDPYHRVIRIIKSRNTSKGEFHANFDGNSALFREIMPINWEECEQGHYGKDFEYE